MTKNKKPNQFNLLEWSESFEEEDDEPIPADPLSCETPVIDPVNQEDISAVEDAEPVAVVVTEEMKAASTEPAPYGYCSCGRAIKIPGLEAHLCPQCGWRTKSR